VFSVIEVALECIHPNPYQQRTRINPKHVERLALSIQSDGLQQPPQAREVPNAPGQYQLVFGHNRFAAYQFLKKQYPGDPKYARMPISVVALNERKMFEGGVTENLQREDISPIAKAKALKTYIETFKATQRECGTLFGISQGAVSNLIRLLSLPLEVITMTDQGLLSERATRLLLGLPDAVAVKIVRGASKLDEDSRPSYVERCVRDAKGAHNVVDGLDCKIDDIKSSDHPRSRPKNSLLLDPEACPCCYRTPKSYVRDGKKWRCGHCQANVQLNILLVGPSQRVSPDWGG